MIGLIGGIGAGKSTAAKRFVELGACVIDADKVGHEVLDRPDVFARMIDTFGECLVGADGKIDRRILGPIVFNDAAKRRELEAIVHPAIREVFIERIGAAMANQNVPLIVLDAAVLLEAKWGDVCDKILFVDASPATRLARLQRDREWTEGELRRREAAQLPLETKRARADAIVTNEGDVSVCRNQIDELFEEWTRAE